MMEYCAVCSAFDDSKCSRLWLQQYCLYIFFSCEIFCISFGRRENHECPWFSQCGRPVLPLHFALQFTCRNKKNPLASWKCLTRRCLNLVNPLHHVRARSVWYQAKFNRPPPDHVDGDRIACLTISDTLPMDHCLF